MHIITLIILITQSGHRRVSMSDGQLFPPLFIFPRWTQTKSETSQSSNLHNRAFLPPQHSLSQQVNYERIHARFYACLVLPRLTVHSIRFTAACIPWSVPTGSHTKQFFVCDRQQQRYPRFAGKNNGKSASVTSPLFPAFQR